MQHQADGEHILDCLKTTLTSTFKSALDRFKHLQVFFSISYHRLQVASKFMPISSLIIGKLGDLNMVMEISVLASLQC